jgi:hypothetical protein
VGYVGGKAVASLPQSKLRVADGEVGDLTDQVFELDSGVGFFVAVFDDDGSVEA